MKGNASRGIILAAVAVLIGGLILWAGFDTPKVSSEVNAGNTTPDPEPDPGDDAGTTAATVVPVATTEPVFTLRPPSEVRVLVANAAGINGAAGRGKDSLVANGYNALPPATAREGISLASTIVYWAEGYEGDAREIARILGGTPNQLQPWPVELPVDDAADANVLVALGSDLATTG